MSDPHPSNSGENSPAQQVTTPPTAKRLSRKCVFGYWLRYVFPCSWTPWITQALVATAQPHIASYFNRLDLQNYIGTTYVLTSTIFLPIFGSLSDIFGRHWALQISLVLFAFGSALSTGARNMTMMLAGRGIAGIGAAGLVTVVRVILADSSSLDDNNTQASMLVILYAIGYSIGPVIGGLLTSISFRWVFAINLPCCAISMILIFFLLRGTTKPAQSRKGSETLGTTYTQESALERFLRIDIIGAALFIAGGILVLLALNWGSNIKWDSARVIVCFVVGGCLLFGFLLWEWYAELVPGKSGKVLQTSSWTKPEVIIPLDVFMNYDVSATQFVAFTSGMVMLVAFYFLSIFYVIVLNKSPTSAGVQLIFFAPGTGAGTITSILLIKYLRQPKIPSVFGTVIVPVALGLLSFATDKNNQALTDGLLVMCGVGVGLTFVPLAIHARFSQPEERVATIISLNLFLRTLGGLVGLAQCSAVLNAKVRTYIVHLLESGLLSQNGVERLASLGTVSSLPAIAALPPAVAQHVRDTFRQGVRWAFISLIPWSGVAVILVLFLSNIHDTHKVARSEGIPASPAQEV